MLRYPAKQELVSQNRVIPNLGWVLNSPTRKLPVYIQLSWKLYFFLCTNAHTHTIYFAVSTLQNFTRVWCQCQLQESWILIHGDHAKKQGVRYYKPESYWVKGRFIEYSKLTQKACGITLKVETPEIKVSHKHHLQWTLSANSSPTRHHFHQNNLT